MALLLVLTGCSSKESAAPMPQADPAVAAPATTTTSTSTTSTSTTTTAIPAVSPPPAAPPAGGGLVPGMQGDAVRALQERLVALHYDPGPIDGRYGGALTSAVMAFQKVNGMPRNGRATPDVLAAIAAATDPAPMLPTGARPGSRSTSSARCCSCGGTAPGCGSCRFRRGTGSGTAPRAGAGWR